MEASFYLAVRILAAAYLIYVTWDVVFTRKMYGLWERIPTREPKARYKKETEPKPVRGKVVGETIKVVLSDPRKTEPEPVESIELEPTDFIGMDTPDDAEEPDDTGYIPAEDELYGDQQQPDYGESSSGVSFEELDEAASVLRTDTKDTDKKTRAARTMFEIQRSEIFDLLAGEESNKLSVEALFAECLDGDGFPLTRTKRIIDFDMSKFV